MTDSRTELMIQSEKERAEKNRKRRELVSLIGDMPSGKMIDYLYDFVTDFAERYDSSYFYFWLTEIKNETSQKMELLDKIDSVVNPELLKFIDDFVTIAIKRYS